MENLLNGEIDFQIVETSFGTWRRFLYSSGALYAEFTSHASYGSWPLFQYSRGRSPQTGATATARGIVAIGRKAVGVIAIGQAAFGVIAIGQLAVGLLVGIGQAATGAVAIGQAAAGIFTVCQLGVGYAGYGMLGYGPQMAVLWPHQAK